MKTTQEFKEKILDNYFFISEKKKNKMLIKQKLEGLISTTPSGDLRNELSDLNILINN